MKISITGFNRNGTQFIPELKNKKEKKEKRKMEQLDILMVGGLITAEHQGRLITARLRELLEA